MKKLVRSAFLLGVLLILGAGFVAGMGVSAAADAPPPPRTHTLRIAAAADLKFALDELLKDFRAKHPDARVEVTYGASGNFLAQLSQGAPFDVFLSADMSYPRKLVEQGLVAPDGVFPYAVGHLVLWVPRDSPLPVEKLGMKALLEPGVRHIAIANPQHAPYGRAAEAALKSQGLHDAVKDKLVLGENVAQTAQFAQSGAADVGIIALSLALAPAMKAQGRYWEVPTSAYPRMEQGGAILQKAKDPELARRFRDALLGPQSRPLLERYGFTAPGP
ncbi:Molybdenum ABC transporter, periplasmic molybdenum-binding protein ModA [Cystobacter fuscus DSM 2262]|uniref:Molybdenum ABC transporter, periplasmic molybdenum-binding protein ModA n=1 Tax=Cystobacter fuscus (strain ATCC 25194 / DSM 2262 / NBRC 100088 / M29) TaxID=1242864 RepID=S9PKE7_CYSF2|nr:molybdate ABC transporter substrate-binding protein [Cystobacter fuscus]EPX63491.1 Molybdenum ABC transporter, periplasmic molybdenum-binding protein ModA [Cystobacter fuscus DSM 2262]